MDLCLRHPAVIFLCHYILLHLGKVLPRYTTASIDIIDKKTQPEGIERTRRQYECGAMRALYNTKETSWRTEDIKGAQD